MRSLGSFGETEPQIVELLTFEYFGHPMRLDPEFGEAAFIDWMEEWGTVDEDDPKSVWASKALMRIVVVPEDFDMLWSLIRKNRQGTQQILELVGELVKAVTGRPTGLPADSSGGRKNTRVKLTAGSSSEDVMRSFLEREHPRADLANVVMLAQESVAG